MLLRVFYCLVLLFFMLSHARDELIEKGHSNINTVSIWMESWTAMRTVIKLQTFQFIVLQGLVGSLPWTAIVFFTLWFELIGKWPLFLGISMLGFLVLI